MGGQLKQVGIVKKGIRTGKTACVWKEEITENRGKALLHGANFRVSPWIPGVPSPTTEGKERDKTGGTVAPGQRKGEIVGGRRSS